MHRFFLKRDFFWHVSSHVYQKEAEQDWKEQKKVNEEFVEKLAKISAALNNYNGQVAGLRTGVTNLNTTQPWREGLDWLEQEIRTAAKERTEAKGNISFRMGTFKKRGMDAKNLLEFLENKTKEVDYLQTEMEAFRNYSQSSLNTAFNTIATLQDR